MIGIVLNAMAAIPAIPVCFDFHRHLQGFWCAQSCPQANIIHSICKDGWTAWSTIL
jgi:hypothetical protein